MDVGDGSKQCKYTYCHKTVLFFKKMFKISFVFLSQFFFKAILQFLMQNEYSVSAD